MTHKTDKEFRRKQRKLTAQKVRKTMAKLPAEFSVGVTLVYYGGRKKADKCDTQKY
jgi:hypothetical protein